MLRNAARMSVRVAQWTPLDIFRIAYARYHSVAASRHGGAS